MSLRTLRWLTLSLLACFLILLAFPFVLFGDWEPLLNAAWLLRQCDSHP